MLHESGKERFAAAGGDDAGTIVDIDGAFTIVADVPLSKNEQRSKCGSDTAQYSNSESKANHGQIVTKGRKVRQEVKARESDGIIVCTV